MIWWHRVKQKVVCINSSNKNADGRPWSTGKPLLKEGDIYIIKSVCVCRSFSIPVFYLEETQGSVSFDGYVCGFDARRFQPVFPQAVDDLRRLTSPTPEQKLAVFEEMVIEQLREAEEV